MIADKTVGHLVYQSGTEDTHGNPVDAWADPVDVKVYGWGPRVSLAQAEPGGTQVLEGLDVYAPKTWAVDALDKVLVEGRLFTVQGDPDDWSNGPLARNVGQKVVHLKRVEGGR
jgi:hypothetical protein